jgi:hypothetical protein
MEKVFTYQRHLRYSYHLLLGILGGAIVLSWLVPQILYWNNFLFIGSTTRLSIYLTFTLVAIGMLVLRVGRELRDTRFIVTNDRLVLRTPTTVRSILFEAVERFGYRRVVAGIGYGELRSGDVAIRLPAVIRDLSGLVAMVRRLLDEAGREGAYDRAEIDEFILTSRVRDLGEERTFAVMPTLVLIMGGMAVLGYVTPYRLWQIPLLLAIAWSLMSGIVPAVAYLVSNAVITQVISRRMRRGRQSAESLEPAPYYGAVAVVTLALYLCLGIAFKAYCRSWGFM